jgi:hypothetical protein
LICYYRFGFVSIIIAKEYYFFDWIDIFFGPLPNETLTYGQIQDLVTQAVEKAIQPLQDEIENLREDLSSIEAARTMIMSDLPEIFATMAKDTKEPGEDRATTTTAG